MQTNVTKRRRRKPIEERFWPKVDRTYCCYGWTGFKDKGGYGRIKGYKEDGSLTTLLAHRVSWEIHHGPIPEGMNVCHRCDTPECSRETHLFLGDDQANVDDCVAKGRHARGEKHGSAKLTGANVLEILHLRREGFSLKKLARQFGVNRQTISAIANGNLWPHLTQEHQYGNA